MVNFLIYFFIVNVYKGKKEKKINLMSFLLLIKYILIFNVYVYFIKCFDLVIFQEMEVGIVYEFFRGDNFIVKMCFWVRFIMKERKFIIISYKEI